MKTTEIIWKVTIVLLCSALVAGAGPVAGKSGARDLVIADAGRTEAVVAVSPEAPGWERAAAEDLVRYIELMSGARPALADTRVAIDTALKGSGPVLLVGSEALNARRQPLERALASVVKKKPFLRADAIAVQRDGNRVYLAGVNAPSHAYAVSHLLQLWGCRWYVPTEFGEVIPDQPTLKIGTLEVAYAPPFEVRQIWVGWAGSTLGYEDFHRRNFNHWYYYLPGGGHALAQYTGELAKEKGVGASSVPFSEPATAARVVAGIEKRLAEGFTDLRNAADPPRRPGISLAIEDGTYQNDSPEDARLQANLYDKYFQKPVMTDPMLALYVNVGKAIKAKHPELILGGMAYVNVTLPPQHKIDLPDNFAMVLAPIDIDPNHGMDDPRSPPRREYGAMLHRWAEITSGRLFIYDYDQGMLVWRDLPNPSHQAFRQDVKHYRDAGILGFNTEGRGAIGTVFLNLYLRAQLMWNPDADVDAMLAEFYPNFYGPAAEPMRRYWGAIYRAWEETIVTEHEFYAAPAIYTPELVETLRRALADAEKAVHPLAAKPAANRSRHEAQYVERVRFTRLSFNVIDTYLAMVRAAATEADYAAAAAAGKRALAARIELTEMNPTFTTLQQEAVTKEPGGDPAWLAGEVKQYLDLLALTDGTKGKLIARLPLEWAYRRDPHDTGLASGFAYQEADLTYWLKNQKRYATPDARKDYPVTEWEMLRTDLYAQAQGVLHPDWQSFAGFMWYKTDVKLTANQVGGKVRVQFPGLFSEAWLYVNGYLVAHRPQKHLWWHNSYKFDWDVDLAGHLKPGRNDIALRVHNTHHNGGLFRRPFLYKPVNL